MFYNRPVSDYVHEELPTEEIERQRALYGPLAAELRELVDAVIRTEVEPEEIERATAQVAELTRRLRKQQIPASYGIRFNADGTSRPWGNAVVGLRNAVAPPLTIHQDPSGRAWSDFHLGAAYEGPPGLVHGGVSALLLDQLLGEAAAAGGKPGMTGTLTLRYRRGTPLGDLRVEAWIARIDGVKTIVQGHLADAEGPTVEAEGVFIMPRWARAPEAPSRFE